MEGLGPLRVNLTEPATAVLDSFRKEMKERVGLDLTADQAASLLVCQAGDRKPSTVAASAARKGRSKYDRKQVPCACDRPDCDKLVTTPDANGKERRYAHGHHPKTTRPKAERRQVPCACGCGELVETPNKWGRPVRFVHGHHGRKKKPESTALVPVERRAPGRQPGIRRAYKRQQAKQSREAVEARRADLKKRAQERREKEKDEEPEHEVVWSGRDSLTPPLHRLSEDLY